VDIYEHTAAHCFRVATGSARGISDVVALEGDRLVLRDGGRSIAFDAVEILPSNCADPLDDSPPAVFAAAIATIAEHHLPAPGETWHREAETIGSNLAEESDAGELHAALVAALALLDDPEVRLAPGGEVAASWPQAPEAGDALSARWPETWEGRMLVGEAAPGVAYVGFLQLLTEGEEDQRALAAALDGALGGADAAVIDLRPASGGVEEAALQVATRFVPSDQVVASLWARAGEGIVAAGDLSVSPRPTGVFPGAVVLLVGPDTSGAGELLARILAGLPGVIVVGEPTAGSPREPLVRALPNGWSLGVPNLDVIGPNGGSWLEPLVPDVMAPTTVIDLAEGRDPGLEAALRVIGGGG